MKPTFGPEVTVWQKEFTALPALIRVPEGPVIVEAHKRRWRRSLIVTFAYPAGCEDKVR